MLGATLCMAWHPGRCWAMPHSRTKKAERARSKPCSSDSACSMKRLSAYNSIAPPTLLSDSAAER